MAGTEEKPVICPKWDLCVHQGCAHRKPHTPQGVTGRCNGRCTVPTGAHGDICRGATEEERVYFEMLGEK